MKKLKCDSCGANLKVDEKGEYAFCEYCQQKYKLKEDKDVNVNINLDETSKEIINTVGKTFKTSWIIFGAIFLIIFVGALFLIISNIMHINKIENSKEKESDPIVEGKKKQEEIFSKYEITAFNMKFENYSGTEYKMFVYNLLDEVVTNNKTNKRKVEISYKDNKTEDPDSIVSLKQNLTLEKYEVKLDYDQDGFVNLVTIEDLN